MGKLGGGWASWGDEHALDFLDVPERKLGSMVIGSVGYNPKEYPIYKDQ